MQFVFNFVASLGVCCALHQLLQLLQIAGICCRKKVTNLSNLLHYPSAPDACSVKFCSLITKGAGAEGRSKRGTTAQEWKLTVLGVYIINPELGHAHFSASKRAVAQGPDPFRVPSCARQSAGQQQRQQQQREQQQIILFALKMSYMLKI